MCWAGRPKDDTGRGERAGDGEGEGEGDPSGRDDIVPLNEDMLVMLRRRAEEERRFCRFGTTGIWIVEAAETDGNLSVRGDGRGPGDSGTGRERVAA